LLIVYPVTKLARIKIEIEKQLKIIW